MASSAFSLGGSKKLVTESASVNVRLSGWQHVEVTFTFSDGFNPVGIVGTAGCSYDVALFNQNYTFSGNTITTTVYDRRNAGDKARDGVAGITAIGYKKGG